MTDAIKPCEKPKRESFVEAFADWCYDHDQLWALCRISALEAKLAEAEAFLEQADCAAKSNLERTKEAEAECERIKADHYVGKCTYERRAEQAESALASERKARAEEVGRLRAELARACNCAAVAMNKPHLPACPASVLSTPAKPEPKPCLVDEEGALASERKAHAQAVSVLRGLFHNTDPWLNDDGECCFCAKGWDEELDEPCAKPEQHEASCSWAIAVKFLNTLKAEGEV